MLFSKLRYIGYALMCPASLLFISSITNQLRFLTRRYVSLSLFIPAFITILAILDLIPTDLLVSNYRPIYIYGLSVVQFESGPVFYLYYIWSNILISLAIGLLFSKAYLDKKYSRDYFILSLGMVCGYLIDLYSVAFNPELRFTMISAGTFLISECAIFYVLRKNSFFGQVNRDDEINNKFHFQNKLLSLVGHDLTGNIHQLARLTNILKNNEQHDHELIKIINDTSLSSVELLSNVMRWVKSQGGSEFTLYHETINIKELLLHLIESLTPVYPKIKDLVILELETEALFIKADKEMLISIFRNLLTNAYKACALEDKDHRICFKINKEQENIHFEITDNGIGLEKSELENLFQTGKMKSSGQGYGIGLYLVKMMVDIHHGSIEIKSQKNHGTQVYFSLPS